MKAPSVAGIVLVSVAVATSLFLGSIGWIGVGFGVMTDCTNNYSCTSAGCSPCSTAGRWIAGGGIGQLLLAALGVVVLRRGRVEQPAYLVRSGVVLLAMSMLTILGTIWRAQESYCQPGSPGYLTSYCPIGG